MSFVAQIRAENYGRLLAEGLTRFADRYGIPTEDNLVTYLLNRGARDPALARSLAKAIRARGRTAAPRPSPHPVRRAARVDRFEQAGVLGLTQLICWVQSASPSWLALGHRPLGDAVSILSVRRVGQLLDELGGLIDDSSVRRRVIE
jgi:hypothetical protein